VVNVPHRYTIASVSWPDHLVFGKDDGKLDTVEAVQRRFSLWREAFGVETVHWREVRTRRDLSHYYASADNPRAQEQKIRSIDWDDFEVVPQVAHDLGMKAQLYVSVLDDGRGLPTEEERAVSFHNDMHGQHVTWQTDWSRDHPAYATVDRAGVTRQWGVLCYGYEEVRRHMADRVEGLVADSGFDGVFLCLRSQARPADHGDQYGFNAPVQADMLALTGKDILQEDFDLPEWRRLNGSYLSRFLQELRSRLNARHLTLSVGLPRGDVIGPPLGNWELQWRAWVAEDLVDELVIDQNSSQCPSMWHQLWPMHRGYGYLQNYIDGKGLKGLTDDIRDTYAPVLAGRPARLYVARQWAIPNEHTEQELLSLPAVSGLVFSTFRHDNPGVIEGRAFYA
jgi:hypothetical protein